MPDKSLYINTDYIISDWQEKLIIENIKDGQVIFDIGANRGFWTYKLAQRSISPAKLFLFEPTPALDIAQEHLLPAFPDTDFRCFNVAMGSKIEESATFFFYDDTDEGFTTFCPKFTFGDGSTSSSFNRSNLEVSLFNPDKIREIKVQVLTIDEFMKRHDITFVDYIKIDTESYDLAVIEGAMSALQNRQIRHIEFEHGPGALEFVSCFDELLNIFDAHYQIFVRFDKWIESSAHDIDWNNWNTVCHVFMKLKE